MEFALEMVFKAAQNGLVISEFPIDYHRRRGESKLSSLSDGWRSVKFILVHSPSYLFFLPAALLAVPGVLGAIALSTGPVDAFGRTWQLNALYLCVAMLLLGTQIAQFGLVARTFGAVQLGDPDPFLTRLYHRIRLEHALLGGAVVLAMGLVVLVAVFATWAAGGFGNSDPRLPGGDRLRAHGTRCPDDLHSLSREHRGSAARRFAAARRWSRTPGRDGTRRDVPRSVTVRVVCAGAGWATGERG